MKINEYFKMKCSFNNNFTTNVNFLNTLSGIISNNIKQLHYIK